MAVEPFHTWLWGWAKKVRAPEGTGLAAATGVWGLFTSRLQAAWNQMQDDNFAWATFVVICVQLGVVFAAVCHLSFLVRKPSPESTVKGVPEAVKAFKDYWYGLWISWFLLYLLLAMLTCPPMGSHLKEFAFAKHQGILLNAVGNLTNTCIIVCYLCMRHMNSQAARWIPVAMAFLLLVLAEFLCAVIIPSESPTARVVQSVFDAINGIIGVISLALIIGRLESLWIGAPGWVIWLLYGYAAIQAYQLVLIDSSHPTQRFLLMLATLPLKVLLYLFVHYLLTHDRLRHYFEQVQVHSSAG